MTGTKAMPMVRTVIALISVLSIQMHNGQAEFPPLSPHCLLVDVDVYYNGSRVELINLRETNTKYKKSPFVTLTSQSWPKELEENCRRVKVLFDYVDIKQSTIILAATFLYKFKDGVQTNPDEKQLLDCINATRVKHNDHVRRYNWLTSIPSLKGKGGQKVKAYAAHYGRNIRHCCLEMTNTTCCPEGTMFVPGDERSSCECIQGHYYDHATPSVCHRCPKNTYQPKPNMERCQPCPEGMMAITEGSTSCTPIVECPEEVIWTVEGTFTWDTTRPGNTAVHKCPYGPSNVTLTRDCHWMSNTSASWTKFDSSSCNPSKHTRTLLTLSETPIDASNVNNVTELLFVETESATELDSYDVALATTTIVDIVDYNSSRIEVAENVIKVIDNILSVNADVLAQSQLHNQTTSRLIKATEKFAENLPLQNGSYTLLVTSNIEIKSQAVIRQSVNENFTFVANSRAQNSSSSINSKITITARAVQEAVQQGSSRVISIVYQNNKLFPVFNKRSSKNGNNNAAAKIGDVILAGKFKDAAIETVERAIELRFPYDIKNGSGFLPRCVYWDFTANDGFGNWSSEGCFYSGTTSGHVTCYCNHMTNFAILLTADQNRDESDSDHRHALSLISYIGCGVSLIAAILTLITYVFFRDLRRSNAQTILCHLCIALIGLLVSYFVVATRDPKTTGCLVTSLLVHYFLLATFAWMGVEGINMYLALVKVVSAHVPRFMPKAVVIAWGFPGLIVIVTGALAYEDYSTEESCFLHGIAFYISVFAPAVLVLSVNFVMFGLTMHSLSQMGKEVSQQNKMKGYHRIKVAFAIMVLLGLTWFFGTVAIGSARLLFQYLFCIFNSLQGFAIFWFHCVRQPEVRQCWADLLRGRRGRQRKYTASTTAPALQATNAVKKTSSSAASPKLPRFNSRGKYNIEQKTHSLNRNENTTKSV